MTLCNLYILKKNNMKTLHIDNKIHESFKKYCKEKGYQINKLTEIIINEYIKNNKKDDINKKN
jgi:hypothetical protein